MRLSETEKFRELKMRFKNFIFEIIFIKKIT